jgi:hypothetical protein
MHYEFQNRRDDTTISGMFEACRDLAAAILAGSECGFQPAVPSRRSTLPWRVGASAEAEHSRCPRRLQPGHPIGTGLRSEAASSFAEMLLWDEPVRQPVCNGKNLINKSANQ